MAESVRAASRHRGGALAIVAICATLLAGCATGDREPLPTEAPTQTVEPTPTPTPDPEFVEGGSASENRPYFEFIVTGLLERSARPTIATIVNSLGEAGFDRATIEITPETTGVGELADSILIGLPIDGQCILGQIIDGEVVSQVADVLGTGRCLVGRTASLD